MGGVPGSAVPRGRPANLTVSMIVSTAIEIIRDRGVDGLSMRLLSDRLGVALGATYRHVPNKHALLRLVAQELYAGIEPADPDLDHLDQARAVILQVHDTLAAYPGMASYIAQHVPEFTSEGLTRLIIDPLTDAGLTPGEAVTITTALIFLNGGHLLMRISPQQREEAAQAFVEGVDLILDGARSRLGAPISQHD